MSRRSSSYQNNNKNVLLGLSFLVWLPSSIVTTLCEGDDKSFLDQMVQKDANGNTDWAKSAAQMTEAEFWDKLATASGDKVRSAVVATAAAAYGCSFVWFLVAWLLDGLVIYFRTVFNIFFPFHFSILLDPNGVRYGHSLAIVLRICLWLLLWLRSAIGRTRRCRGARYGFHVVANSAVLWIH